MDVLWSLPGRLYSVTRIRIWYCQRSLPFLDAINHQSKDIDHRFYRFSVNFERWSDRLHLFLFGMWMDHSGNLVKERDRICSHNFISLSQIESSHQSRLFTPGNKQPVSSCTTSDELSLACLGRAQK